MIVVILCIVWLFVIIVIMFVCNVLITVTWVHCSHLLLCNVIIAITCSDPKADSACAAA